MLLDGKLKRGIEDIGGIQTANYSLLKDGRQRREGTGMLQYRQAPAFALLTSHNIHGLQFPHQVLILN